MPLETLIIEQNKVSCNDGLSYIIAVALDGAVCKIQQAKSLTGYVLL